MKLVNPEVISWSFPKSWREQVARAARICYGNDKGKRSDEDMCEFLKKSGHLSMFRHGTLYFVFTLEQLNDYLTIARLIHSPYIGTTYKRVRKNRIYFVAMNVQAYMDLTPQIHNQLKPYEVSLAEFVVQVKKHKHPTALSLIRYTLCVTTQISTSRELNRTSPNNIAEQSTRYVNFGKRGGITICKPHWYDGVSWFKRFLAWFVWAIAEIFYHILLKMDMKPQDARGVLPLDTATRVVYTYNVFEWRHILDLRLLGKSGVPHPNPKIVAQMIADELQRSIVFITGNEDYKLI